MRSSCSSRLASASWPSSSGASDGSSRWGEAVSSRAGIGYDSHRFEAGRRLVLGGVEIPEAEHGLAGHSDADVLTHAVIDALLGAAGLGDIGQHFPDTDERWKDADSMELLAEVCTFLEDH